MRNILLTGGCGFIGSHTCIALLERGYKVTILDSLINSNLNVIKEPFNKCRQELPKAYLHNGCIDILNYSTLSIKEGTISGNNIYPFIMNENDNIDIDTNEDWNMLVKNR